MDNTFKRYIHFPPQQLSFAKLFIYIFIVYLFGVLIRLILFYQAGQIGPLWDGSDPIAIWTPDAGRYGFYAKEILAGVELPFRDDYLLGHLIAFVSGFFHLSLDWTMVLLPIFIAPLIAIPMVMIGTSIKQPVLGLLSALVAVSGTFFYMRTHIGYMDTDGVNLFLIMMGIAWIIKGFEHKSLFYTFLGALALLLFGWWYHSAPIINLLIVLTALVYLFLYHRKNKTMLGGFILLVLAIAPAAVLTKLVVIVLFYSFFSVLNRYEKVDHRFYWILLSIGFVAALFLVHPDQYIHRAVTYLTPANEKVFSGKGITYHYLNDLKFVSEVGGVNLWKAYAPLFISVIYVLVATGGYFIMLAAYPLMLLTLPLMILGYMSTWAGLRFAMYATPVLAFGFVYLLFLFKNILLKRYERSCYVRRLPYYGTTLVLLLMIYNIFAFNTSAAMGLQFYSWDKALLKSFSKNLSKKDTIVTWWDYGWPLWYYTGYNNTLTDNGYHGGPDSHLVAQILLSDDPYFTANAARYLSYYRPPSNSAGAGFTLPKLAKDHNLTKLFKSFHQQKKISLPGEEGNVYIILHQNMLSYIGILMKYAYWDFRGGKYKAMPIYKATPVTRPFSHNYSLLEGYSYILDSSDGMVVDANGNKTPVNTLMIAQNNTRKESFSFHKNSNMNLLDAKGLLLWMNKKAYNAFYIQAMLLDVYDHKLFEKVGETGRMKIFRVKRANE